MVSNWQRKANSWAWEWLILYRRLSMIFLGIVIGIVLTIGGLLAYKKFVKKEW